MPTKIIEARATVAGTLLLACVAALALAQVASLATADRYLEQSAASQGQSAAVSAIGATVAQAVARSGRPAEPALAARLGAQLAAYRRSIEDEGRRHAMPAERAAAARFALALRAAADDRAAVAALDDLSRAVADIAAHERGETLAAAAAALAAVAGGALASSNRRLARLVGERTAELLAKSERLAEIDRTRRLFFAKLSHERRTPVTVMRGEAEVALRLDGGAPELRAALGESSPTPASSTAGSRNGSASPAPRMAG